MVYSKRTSEIDISGIRMMFEMAKGKDIINLGLGEPDFPIPSVSKKAVIEALENDQTHYTPSNGLIELREGITKKLSRNRIRSDPEDIIVTSGGSEALEIALLALCNEGDEVLIPDPGFVSYAPLTRIAGGVPISYDVKEDDDFRTPTDSIRGKITNRTKAIILNSPSNPTGAVSKKSEIIEIASLAEEHDINVISDEVYDEIIYEGKHYSPGRYTDLAVTVNSFSKTYAMTGLRLGYVHANSELIEEMLKIHQYIQASTSSLSQAAAIAAIHGGDDYTTEMVSTLKKRRDLILGFLKEIDNLSYCVPKGAIYVFPNFSAFGDTKELAIALLKEARVVVTPGTAFGANGNGYLRFSYAQSEEKIATGMERIQKHLKIYMEKDK